MCLVLVLPACGGGNEAPAAETRPDRIVVDPAKVRGKLNPRAIGINLNYLMDDESRRPERTRPLTEALKDMGIRILRFPGGDKSDTHLWSIPPYEKAVPTIAVSGDWDWPAMDKRFFEPDRRTWKIDPLDFDEYMSLVRELGVEATVVVPVDPGFREPREHYEVMSMDKLVRNAVEWVKYARERRFPVRYWEIGNESFFETGTEEYTEALVRLARAMRKADPKIKIGAVGMYGGAVGRVDSKRGNRVPWNKPLLEKASGLIDYLSVHDYPNHGWKSYRGYLERDPDFARGIRRTRESIGKWAHEEDRERIRIALTEYGAIDYAKPAWKNVADLGHSLLLLNMVGQLMAEPDLDCALMWNTRWIENDRNTDEVHDALTSDNNLTPTGMVLKIWSSFLGEVMLEIEDDKLLKVFATHSPGTGGMNILLINKGLSGHRVIVEVRGGSDEKGVRWQYAGSGPDDLRPVWQELGPVSLKAGELSVSLSPVSLTVLAL